MNCEICRNNIMKHLDGEINDVENARMQKHMETCGQCAGLYAGLTEIFADVRDSGEERLPQDFQANVMKRINAYEEAGREKAAKWVILGFNAVMAAALALIFIFGSGALVSVQYALDLVTSAVKSLIVYVSDIVATVFTLNSMATKYLYVAVIAAAALLLPMHRAFIQIPRIRAGRLSGAIAGSTAGSSAGSAIGSTVAGRREDIRT